MPLVFLTGLLPGCLLQFNFTILSAGPRHGNFWQQRVLFGFEHDSGRAEPRRPGRRQNSSAATTQPSDAQSDLLQANDRAQPTNSASNMVEMAQGKFQVELGAKVAKASDEMLGTLINTFA